MAYVSRTNTKGRKKMGDKKILRKLLHRGIVETFPFAVQRAKATVDSQSKKEDITLVNRSQSFVHHILLFKLKVMGYI